MRRWVYRIGPIDDWGAMPTVADTLNRLAQPGHDFEGAMKLARGITRMVQEAMADARIAELGWDGAIRNPDGGPYLICIPDPETKSIKHGIAWKGHAGGMTWIWSPLPINRFDALEGTMTAVLGSENSGEHPAYKPS